MDACHVAIVQNRAAIEAPLGSGWPGKLGRLAKYGVCALTRLFGPCSNEKPNRAVTLSTCAPLWRMKLLRGTTSTGNTTAHAFCQ